MKKLIRDNIIYILFVLGIWAITFPFLFYYQDFLFAKITYFWSPPGYKPPYMENLLKKGDSYLVTEIASSSRIREIFSSDPEPELPPLDLEMMEAICDYYEGRTHKDNFLDAMTWFHKKQILRNHLKEHNRELILSFDPKVYWKKYSPQVLLALDYYRRALNFSGPEIRVPRKIEEVAKATCRNSEILLAYTTHIYQTESYVEKEYLKDELERTDFLRKPSLLRRFILWLRGREWKNREFPVYSRLSPKQIQLRVWDKIRSGEVREITRSEFVESLQKALSSKGIYLKESAPMEALDIYERLLFFTSHQKSPLEYRRYRKARAEIFLDLAKEKPDYYGKAIAEYSDARELPNPQEIPVEILPALLVESFALELGIVKVYSEEQKYSEALRILNRMEPALRNLDERSAGSPGLLLEKKSLLKEYRRLKKISLQKLGRFEEADEVPDE